MAAGPEHFPIIMRAREENEKANGFQVNTLMGVGGRGGGSARGRPISCGVTWGCGNTGGEGSGAQQGWATVT